MTGRPDTLTTDVLVIGGGPAATWAAISATEAGARVILVDKGYCGTSGATAAGGNNLWLIPPGPRREESVRDREKAAGRITDADWMFRVLATAWDRVDQLAAWGYPFPAGSDGRPMRSSLQGPEYMRRMRRKVHRSGVRILDHHPALELTVDDDGVVDGATGIARQEGGRPWRVTAGAVVLATGGTAFLSGTFGTNVDTGDGLLMAAEHGAALSGMEFSTAYALAPEWGTHTKGRMLQWGSFFDEHGQPLPTQLGLGGRQDAQAQLAHGRRVFARIDRAPAHIHQTMRDAQPNYFLPLDKAGIDPFTTAYPVRMVHEGSVRGTGGLRLTGPDCATTVPGLYAAGDAATRELITGSRSGGGSHNGSWAIASGTFAGRGAAEFSRRRTTRAARAGAESPLNVRTRNGAPTVDEVVRAAQQHVLPPLRSYLKTAERLAESAAALETVWRDIADGLAPVAPRDTYKVRQAVALVAAARWVTAASLARAETRGLHRREDIPDTDARFDHRILVGGLDEVWTAPDPVAPRLVSEAVA
ncbi:FAD-dependent oxidoreductase [Mycolicibacterium smegmatis]|nr:FAD-binding protein [Mycolicibacterium smegmatis]ABK73735.1 FAD dependent oxidoreductase [Mycolicibacterium smegmatis MC2 155]AIU10551.1 pyridine nucleotide-disulfide oxidoreductase [Mycolicibacterium smegmatis MC2 155]AIU17176.1 pyridine nucleotide-disulfide oxidoreductase [Mycolicibacterium smegmatis]AIU23799.1 pyridine nucleotide-disulfide oxidoreductase [Mycolicibacterium smegmatis]MBE9617528.1 FAD-binding protein [Mycolicibacterium smegmatis]